MTTNTAIKKEALARMVAMASSIELVAKQREELARLREEVAAADALLAELLPIEAEAREELAERIAPARKRMRALSYQEAGLKRLTLEPLTWRRSDGLPSLAVLSVKHPFVRLWKGFMGWCDRIEPQTTGSGSGTWTAQPEPKTAAPKTFASLYSDLGNTEITTGFLGVVPPDVRAQIRRWSPLFVEILIVAEPVTWMVSLPDPDPIVCGWDGSHFWVVDAFDVTEVEEALLGMAR